MPTPGEALMLAGGTGLVIGLLTWFATGPLITAIPKALEMQWEQELAERAHTQAEGNVTPLPSLSRRHQTLVCVVAALIGVLVVYVRGLSGTTVLLLAYLQASLLLAAINWRTAMLPDKIVLPLAWAGLLINAWAGRGADHIYGATVGYGVPWLIYWAIKLKSGGEAIGHGDMKAFGMVGACFGLVAMPTVFVTFFTCLIVQLMAMQFTGLRFAHNRGPGRHLPTGVAHLASSLAWVVGVHLA